MNLIIILLEQWDQECQGLTTSLSEEVNHCVSKVLKLQLKTRGHILYIIAAVICAYVSLLLLIISDFIQDWSFFNTDFISSYIHCKGIGYSLVQTNEYFRSVYLINQSGRSTPQNLLPKKSIPHKRYSLLFKTLLVGSVLINLWRWPHLLNGVCVCVCVCVSCPLIRNQFLKTSWRYNTDVTKSLYQLQSAGVKYK